MGVLTRPFCSTLTKLRENSRCRPFSKMKCFEGSSMPLGAICEYMCMEWFRRRGRRH